jgi:hypothetical protein
VLDWYWSLFGLFDVKARVLITARNASTVGFLSRSPMTRIAGSIQEGPCLRCLIVSGASHLAQACITIDVVIEYFYRSATTRCLAATTSLPPIFQLAIIILVYTLLHISAFGSTFRLLARHSSATSLSLADSAALYSRFSSSHAPWYPQRQLSPPVLLSPSIKAHHTTAFSRKGPGSYHPTSHRHLPLGCRRHCTAKMEASGDPLRAPAHMPNMYIERKIGTHITVLAKILISCWGRHSKLVCSPSIRGAKLVC